MTPGKTGVCLRSPELVDWVKDLDQVLIINKRRDESHLLCGEEAIVWGWLVSAYSYPKIVRMLENLLALSNSQAEKRLWGFLQKWHLADLLEFESREHG